MQSVSITTNVLSSNPAQKRCTRYNKVSFRDKKLDWGLAGGPEKRF